MESVYDNIDLLRRIMNMLEKQFGQNCEIVLHDFTRGYDKTVVDIRNGHITGRSLSSVATNLGLEIMRGSTEGGDRFNYITYTKSGRILRSSSIHFENDKKELIGSLCVNLDITECVQFENYLRSYNQYDVGAGEPDAPAEEREAKEFFVSDVQELLDELIKQAFQMVGKPAAAMTRQEKIAVVRQLDQKGTFFITKSSDSVCEQLNISKYTFYSYLESARKEADQQDSPNPRRKKRSDSTVG